MSSIFKVDHEELSGSEATPTSTFLNPVNKPCSLAGAGRSREDADVVEPCDKKLFEDELASVEAEHDEEEASVPGRPSVQEESREESEGSEAGGWNMEEADAQAEASTGGEPCEEGQWELSEDLEGGFEQEEAENLDSEFQEVSWPKWQRSYRVAETYGNYFPYLLREVIGRVKVHRELQCELEKEYICTCPEIEVPVKRQKVRDMDSSSEEQEEEEEEEEKEQKEEEKEEEEEEEEELEKVIEKEGRCSVVKDVYEQDFYERRAIFYTNRLCPPLELIIRMGWHRAKVDQATQCESSWEDEEVEPRAISGPEGAVQDPQELRLEGAGVPRDRGFFYPRPIPEDAYSDIFEWAFREVKEDVGIQCDMSVVEPHPVTCKVCGGRQDWRWEEEDSESEIDPWERRRLEALVRELARVEVSDVCDDLYY